MICWRWLAALMLLCFSAGLLIGAEFGNAIMSFLNEVMP